MRLFILISVLLSFSIFSDELPTVSKDDVLNAMETIHKNPQMKSHLGNDKIMEKVREKLKKMSPDQFKELQKQAKEKLNDKQYKNELNKVLNSSLPKK